MKGLTQIFLISGLFGDFSSQRQWSGQYPEEENGLMEQQLPKSVVLPSYPLPLSGGRRKPYLCPHCGKQFYAPCHLERHIRTHTGEKPFVCGKCGKAFSQRSNMVQHMYTHEKHSGPSSERQPTSGDGVSQSDFLSKYVAYTSPEKPPFM